MEEQHIQGNEEPSAAPHWESNNIKIPDKTTGNERKLVVARGKS